MRLTHCVGIVSLSICLMSCGHTTKRNATPRYHAQTAHAVVKAPVIKALGVQPPLASRTPQTAQIVATARTTQTVQVSQTPQVAQNTKYAAPSAAELKSLTQALAEKKNPANGVVYDKFFEPTAPVKYWQWPARGRVVGYYSASNKGINIAGRAGAPVVAAAFGKVVYAGNGIRGYGNLIIIKHNSRFLTAYANNDKILVDQDAIVKRGQKIAEMGSTGTNRVKLHFEIRQNGSPVNPLSYLPKKG